MKNYKTKLLYLLISCLFLFLLGCDDTELLNEEKFPSFISKLVTDTDNIKKNKDLGAARDLWGDVSKYSVLAEEYGNTELSEKLSSLAASYPFLIEYCSGNDNKENLKKFDDKFIESIKNLKEINFD